MIEGLGMGYGERQWKEVHLLVHRIRGRIWRKTREESALVSVLYAHVQFKS